MLELLAKVVENANEELGELPLAIEKDVREVVKLFILDLEEIKVANAAYVVLVVLLTEMETFNAVEVEDVAKEVMQGNAKSDVTTDDAVKSDMVAVVTVNYMVKEVNHLPNNVVEMVSVETKRILAKSNISTRHASVFIVVHLVLNEQGNVVLTRMHVKSEPNYVKRIKVPTMEVKTTGKLPANVEVHMVGEISGIADLPEVADFIDFRGV